MFLSWVIADYCIHFSVNIFNKDIFPLLELTPKREIWLKICNNNNLSVRIGGILSVDRIHSTFHVSRVKPALTHAPVFRVIGGGEAFTVSRLMECRRRGRGLQYVVDWEGYGTGHQAWTPARFILDMDLMRGFNRRHPVPDLKTPRGAS